MVYIRPSFTITSYVDHLTSGRGGRTPCVRKMISTMRNLRVFGLFVVLAIVIGPTPTSAQVSDPNTAPLAAPSATPTKFFQFNIEYANVTVNCRTKTIVTVNGQYPGPIIYANEGDRIIVNVTNNSNANMTIHFHGVRQVRSPWMDGVAYVSQCPIRPGDYFTHDFLIPLQRGTLLWHAHIGWQRATVHGAFITYPAEPYPFPLMPDEEFPIVIGEWWDRDVEEIETETLILGRPFPVSDAITINGRPGPNYNCSDSEGVSILNVRRGRTYFLQIVNAAVNTQIFFEVANHTFIVVEADAEYVQPFETPIIAIAPGQTTGVLLRANQEGGTYYMSVSGWGRDPNPNPKPAAILQYPQPSPVSEFPFSPIFPAYTDKGVVYSFTNALRTLFPGRVPLTVNRNLFFVVGLSSGLCLPPPEGNCTGYRVQAQINNITFQLPTSTSLLEANYFNRSAGVYTEDFPQVPEHPFDYTGPFSPPAAGRVSEEATKILPIPFNETVQLVLQDTMVLGFENHPFHLHGHNFYILGQGFGNYDNNTDPLAFNLYDPPLRNTVGVPYKGWVAIRFKANNPGLWLFHCHLDKHTSWGMQMVFNIHNGIGANNSYNPPPDRLVSCSA